MSRVTPNRKMQLTIAIVTRLATPSLASVAIAADLKRYSANWPEIELAAGRSTQPLWLHEGSRRSKAAQKRWLGLESDAWQSSTV